MASFATSSPEGARQTRQRPKWMQAKNRGRPCSQIREGGYCPLSILVPMAGLEPSQTCRQPHRYSGNATCDVDPIHKRNSLSGITIGRKAPHNGAPALVPNTKGSFWTPWCLVPMAGLEPARLTPLPPQDSVSTNSTTSAWDIFLVGGRWLGLVGPYRRRLIGYRRQLGTHEWPELYRRQLTLFLFDRGRGGVK